MALVADTAKECGKGGFIVGGKVSFADICCRDTFEHCEALLEKGVFTDDKTTGVPGMSLLKAANANVDKMPTVKAYLAKRKDTPF